MHYFRKFIFGMKIDMFRIMPVSIVRNSFTVNSAMVYVVQVCRQLSNRIRMELQFHPDPVYSLQN
jgi:hypothetical protein